LINSARPDGGTFQLRHANGDALAAGVLHMQGEGHHATSRDQALRMTLQGTRRYQEHKVDNIGKHTKKKKIPQ